MTPSEAYALWRAMLLKRLALHSLGTVRGNY